MFHLHAIQGNSMLMDLLINILQFAKIYLVHKQAKSHRTHEFRSTCIRTGYVTYNARGTKYVYTNKVVVVDGGFFLACEDLGRMLDIVSPPSP